ncbi:hypothetical protein ABTN08_19235, partial [Acinetobacter baumannii]
NAFADDIAACREAGMNDFVVKPARKKAVVEAILRVLSAPAGPQQAPAWVAAPPLSPEVDADPAKSDADLAGTRPVS